VLVYHELLTLTQIIKEVVYSGDRHQF